MSTIKPFCAIRPAADKAAKVASHSIERYSKATIEEILSGNPISFLQVIYSGKSVKGPYHEQLKAIKKKFDLFNAEKILQQDKKPCFYIYRQVKDKRSHLGIIALASVEDYKKGIIRIHEQTLAEREEKLKEYLTVCDFNAEPVCLTHPYNKELDKFLKAAAKGKPLYDFSADHIHHSIWQVNTKAGINSITKFFKKMPNLYIADGHHRAASSTLLAEMKKKSNKKHTGKEAYNYFMSAFFAETELTIVNFDRMVATLNQHSTKSFLKALSTNFEVTLKGKKAYKPASASEMSLYIEKNWYLLKTKKSVGKTKDPVDTLDVSILSNYILSPILNITDLRNDKRIAFIPGIKDLEEIHKAVDSGKMKAAFCLYPISFKELKAVADSGREMPPKSTWIEPKLESGLLVYSLSKNS
jgi:uncharacterized protein (DUF1015 family)